MITERALPIVGMISLISLLAATPVAAQDAGVEEPEPAPEPSAVASDESSAVAPAEPSAVAPAEPGAMAGSSTSSDDLEDPAEATAEADEDEDLGVDPYVPGVELPDDEGDEAVYDDEIDELEDLPDGKPFAKGDMELGLGLGGFGSSDYFVLGIGASFAYYVVNRFAPGIDLEYAHTFSDDWEYPDSMRTLPFLKFVIIRSQKFAPFLILAGGRDFQWGGSSNPSKGFRPADAWILGGGAGAHIGIGDHFAIKLQILALYYWYDDTKVGGFKDSVFTETDEATGEKYVLVDDDLNVGCDPAVQECYQYDEDGDPKDKDGELFFPLITIGFALFF